MVPPPAVPLCEGPGLLPSSPPGSSSLCRFLLALPPALSLLPPPPSWPMLNVRRFVFGLFGAQSAGLEVPGHARGSRRDVVHHSQWCQTVFE